ncbi:MAG: hypothetical protein ACREF3_04715, partial [Acetobacteraceae bacterium]
HNLRQKFGNATWAKDAMAEEMSNAPSLRMKTALIYEERWAAIRDARENRNTQGRRLSAAAIMADNIGNCFEHSVLACHYLNRRGIASYMADTDDNTNHCFVLIGAPAGLDGQTVNVTAAAPGAIAGAFTVVCDPWYHEWFSVQQDWGRKMWHIFGVTTKDPPMPDPVPLTLTSGAHVT